MAEVPKDLHISPAKTVLANIQQLNTLQFERSQSLESFLCDRAFPQNELLQFSEVAEVWDSIVSDFIVTSIKRHLLRFRKTRFCQFPFLRCLTPSEVIPLDAEYQLLYAWRVQSVDRASSPRPATSSPHLQHLCCLS